MERWSNFGLLAYLISAATGIAHADVPDIRYLGYAEIPASDQFRGARIGGLSGVDFDPATGLYNFNSDARGEGVEGDPRFFSARLIIAGDGIENIRFENVQYFFDENGERFETGKNDFEALRKTPAGYGVFVASERNEIGAPSIFEFGFDGSFVREFGTPAHFAPVDGAGARNNAGFEALAIADGGKRLLAGMETALIQDGPMSSKEKGTTTRIVSYSLANGAPIIDGQYAYVCDPMSALVDMVSIGRDRLIVLERSYTGARADGAKLYVVNLKGATDVSDLYSLRGESFHRAKKTLLFDLKTLGIQLHNVEGVTIGPELGGGGRLLLAVSDNNFDADIPTQLFAFAIRLPNGSNSPIISMTIAGLAFLAAILFGWRILNRGKRPAQ
ncbi:MAG: esterase-like activity of phytase family protein [Marinicaulis sp.]|nr:esterase-like activity of phytase family protein [Marinicaulis sp.]NNE40480.1 esterase-like activity of phytase family protein [Marinicaulis sp.]NNL89564.1 esterase-like activity of phytase family protein [Marinicaulis sp.]